MVINIYMSRKSGRQILTETTCCALYPLSRKTEREMEEAFSCLELNQILFIN